MKATELDTALAAAEAEADRLRAKHNAVAQAEAEARHAAELRVYGDAYRNQVTEHNAKRQAAEQHIETLAAADTLDCAALFAAFTELKTADAQAVAAAIHGARLDQVDPLTPNHIGAPRARVNATTPKYRDLTWSIYLDRLIERRTEAEQQRHLNDLNAEADRQIEAEAIKARNEAAAAN